MSGLYAASIANSLRSDHLKSKGIYTGTVLVLGIVGFIETLAFSIPVSYFPNYALSLGATVASIGVFTSSFMANVAKAWWTLRQNGKKESYTLGTFW